MSINRTPRPQWVAALLLSVLAVFASASNSAYALQSVSDSKDQSKAAEKKSDEKKQPASSESSIIAIVGGDVYTVTREVIRRGTVLVKDGKILKVGRDVNVPDAALVIDATGKVITPGFISMSTRGVGLDGTPAQGQKFEDQLDPFDTNVKLSLGVGITTACLQVTNTSSSSSSRRAENELFVGLDPEIDRLEKVAVDFNVDFGDPDTALCECCGLPILPTAALEIPTPEPRRTLRNALIKMSAGRLEGMMVDDSVFYHLNSGALTGALNQHTWRANIHKAREYLKAKAEYEKAVTKGEKPKAVKKPVSDELLELVQQKTALRIAADDVSTLRDILALARDLDYRVVIDSATEGWVIPDELAEADASVLITPRRRRRSRFAMEDMTGSNIQSSRIFESAGVPFGIIPLSSSISLNGLAGRDLTSLPLEAAFAVRGGCSEKTALEALTIVPAEMLGLEDRLGSIEVGKDADLLILNGQPMDYRTYVETAIVNGHVAYERGEDRIFPVYER